MPFRFFIQGLREVACCVVLSAVRAMHRGRWLHVNMRVRQRLLAENARTTYAQGMPLLPRELTSLFFFDDKTISQLIELPLPEGLIFHPSQRPKLRRRW